MPKVVRELTRLIKTTYIQSLQIVSGDRPAEDFVQVGINYSGLEALIPKLDKKPSLQNTIQKIVQTKFPYSPNPKKRKTNDTGWLIGRVFKEIFWDIVTYRIGIREISLSGYEFASTSSVVTVPARSPRPIRKVMLKVDETIPVAFRPTQAWIHYHVSFDNGTTWYRINPIGKPSRFDQTGQVVPRIITVGSDSSVSSEETINIPVNESVYEVRLKISMFSDPEAENNEKLSPILHGYSLMIYPVGGLTQSNTGVN